MKDYIDAINKELIDGTIPIADRALKVKSLPQDSVFIAKLSSVETGISFLKQFQQFVERVTSSIVEGIATGVSIVYLYQQKRMEHSIQNIENSMHMKDELNKIKNEGEVPESEEEVRNQPR